MYVGVTPFGTGCVLDLDSGLELQPAALIINRSSHASGSMALDKAKQKIGILQEVDSIQRYEKIAWLI